MQLIRHRKLAGLIPFQLLKDNSFLYFISVSDKTYVSCYDVLKQTVLHRFSIDTIPQHGSLLVIDDTSLYFPTQFGQILKINKNDGEVLKALDVGWGNFCYSLLQDNNSVYSLCSLPISNGIKISVNQYCLIINDKITGEKTGQSQFFSSNKLSCILDDNYIWISSGNKLSKFLKTGELVNEMVLTYIPSDKIISHNGLLILFNNQGYLTFVDKEELAVVNGMVVEKNDSSPIIKDDILYWFCENNLYQINLDTYLKEKIIDIISLPKGIPAIVADNILITDDASNLVRYNITNKQIFKLDLQEKNLSNLIVLDNNIFVFSDSSLFQLEI